jgi:thiaminase/transcriptional activator TenA
VQEGGLDASERVRKGAEAVWGRALAHRFVHEVANDAIADAVFSRYLVVEFGFLETAARVLGAAVRKAPSFEQCRYLASGLLALTTDQYGYFLRVFSTLGIDSGAALGQAVPPAARGLHEHFLDTADQGSYEEILACMLGAEFFYLTWCTEADKTPASRGPIREWVKLHTAKPFAQHVRWIKAELDRRARDLDEERFARVQTAFTRTLEAEIRFHDSAYGPTAAEQAE